MLLYGVIQRECAALHRAQNDDDDAAMLVHAGQSGAGPASAPVATPELLAICLCAPRRPRLHRHSKTRWACSEVRSQADSTVGTFMVRYCRHCKVLYYRHCTSTVCYWECTPEGVSSTFEYSLGSAGLLMTRQCRHWERVLLWHVCCCVMFSVVTHFPLWACFSFSVL